MPRKPKPGPPILRIETMSDGKAWYPPAGVDDFTQQPIARAVDTGPVRPRRNAQDIIDERNRAKAQARQLMLQRVLPQLFEPVAQPARKVVPKGMREVGTLGTHGAMLVVMPSWRKL